MNVNNFLRRQPLRKLMLTAALVVMCFGFSQGQVTMRVYLDNGASAGIPTGFWGVVMDSFNYTTGGVPATTFANYYMENGMTLVHELDAIDSVVYVGVPPPK